MRYWLIFDPGLRSNLEKLYAWLDALEAVECGQFAASFVTEKTLQQLAGELKPLAGENIRLYLIGRRTPSGKFSGGFIAGRRKSAPWAGYAPKPQPEEEEVE